MKGQPSRARRAYRVARKKAKRAYSHIWLQALRLRNRWARSSVVGSANVIVSLTSYGSRVDVVGYTIESIAAGRIRPRRLILWLDEQAAYANRSAALRRLEARGLEIRMTPNYGPHKKYFPALPDALADRVPLVTADDDVLYPRSWLSRLLTAAATDPSLVHCYRASVVAVHGTSLAPYDAWPRCVDDRPSLAHFATGVSGVYYPPRMISSLLDRGTEFLKAAPRADDIWLHWVALQERVAVHQISRVPKHFPVIPGTQQQTLVAENVHQGANDQRIAALYNESDVAVLAEAASRLARPAIAS